MFEKLLQAIDKETFAKEILGDGSTDLNGFVPTNFAKIQTQVKISAKKMVIYYHIILKSPS